MNWLSNPHADYVLAAYGVALVTLAGLGIATCVGYWRRAREWKRLADK